MDISDIIRQERIAQCKSYNEVAAKANISGVTVSAIERNKTSPSINTLLAVLDSLGVTKLTLVKQDDGKWNAFI